MTDNQPAGEATPHICAQLAGQRRTSHGPQGGGKPSAAGKPSAGRAPSAGPNPAAGRGAATGREAAAGTEAAGDPGPSTEPPPEGVMARIRVDSLAGVLAVVPYLLGFRPRSSLVVIGIEPPRGQIKLTFRYDLPDPPDSALASEIAVHAAEVLAQQQVGTAIAVGYGAGPLVTPVIELLRTEMRGAGVFMRDLIRVQDDRYWSYLCEDPRCCPAEGKPFDALAHPAAAALTTAGIPAYPDRESLARSLAPLGGETAVSMAQATQRALARSEQLLTEGGARPVSPGRAAAARPAVGNAMRVLVTAGRRSVVEAIGIYRGGGRITDDDQFAWLSVVLNDLRVRDDAWARMDPQHRRAHRQLWTDVVRRACPPYVPAPASLLAFTAWQSGDGALANIAIERAIAASPGYSMALLLSEAIESGLPPSAARLPMTPDEVNASYAHTYRAGR